MKRVPLVLAASLGIAAAAAAQTPVRYLSPADPIVPVIEYLVRTGVIGDPDPLTRPMRRTDLARVLAGADTAEAGERVRALVRRVAAELAEPADTVRWRVDLSGGLLGASDPRRDAVRAAPESSRVFPELRIHAAFELPHAAFVTSAQLDNRLRHDPDYSGKKDRGLAGRFDEAYALASWRWVEVFLGRTPRNWGPAGVDGLFVSANPFSYDHLFVRFGTRRVRLELLATELSPIALWNTTTPVNRFFGAHRLVLNPSDRLTVAFNESVVYAQTGGVPRGFEPWYLNALAPFMAAQYDGDLTANLLVGADVAWRPRRALRFDVQLMVDDFQIDDAATSDNEPTSYAFTLGASGGLRRGAMGWAAFYTRVSNLAYRTPANEEQYATKNTGLARNQSDYDQATARLSLPARSDLLLTGEVTLLRQGEGDFRIQYPDSTLYAQTPTFLAGVVTRTVRIGAAARWDPRPWLSLDAELARHAVRNAGHVDGARDGRWVWRVAAALRRTWAGRLEP